MEALTPVGETKVLNHECTQVVALGDVCLAMVVHICITAPKLARAWASEGCLWPAVRSESVLIGPTSWPSNPAISPAGSRG